MSRVVATVGAFAGAGATTVVTALGAALAEQRSHVGLVDASPAGAGLAEVLPLEGGGELADALRRRADLAAIQATGPHDLRVYPAAPDTNWAAIRPSAVENAYDRFRDAFDVVLVDCGSELGPASVAWIGYADELLLVTSPDVGAATAEDAGADASADVADVAALGAALDVPVRGVVANRVVPDEAAAAREALAASPHELLALFPEDRAVDAAASAGESLFVHEPDSQLAECAWEFATRFRDGEHAEPVVPEQWSGLGGGSSSEDREQASKRDEHSSRTDGTAGGSDGTAGDGATSDTSDEATRDDPRTNSTTNDATNTTTADVTSTESADDARTNGANASADGGTVGGGGVTSESSQSTPTEADASRDTSTPSDTSAEEFEWSDSGSLADDIGSSLEESDETKRRSDGSSGRSAPGGADDGAGSETGTSGDDTAGTTCAADADGDAGGSSGSSEDATSDEATISDEQIEEVFKETMERAKSQRDGSEADGDGRASGDESA